MHYYQHKPSTDPFRRRVVGRFGVWQLPDSFVRHSTTRRDQLVNLGVDAHRVLVMSPPDAHTSSSVSSPTVRPPCPSFVSRQIGACHRENRPGRGGCSLR